MKQLHIRDGVTILLGTNFTEVTTTKINMNTIAINGNPVVLADVDIEAPSDFTWGGYMHHLVAGQVFTATVRVAKTLVAYVAP